MQGSKKVELKLQKLQTKIKLQSQKLRKEKERNRQLKKSRLGWKNRAKTDRKILRASQSRQKKEVVKKGECPKNHSYRSDEISLTLQIRKNGKCSLRSTQAILKILMLFLGLELRIPSHESISLWEKRIGLYSLKHRNYASDKYAIIIDESITIGKEKILLILGVNLSSYSFEKPLTFSDTEVLSIGVSQSWKWTDIVAQIDAIKSKGILIKYGVSDSGSNILKALSELGIIRISDCTHALGKLLEKQYKQDAGFMAFSQLCGKMRREYTNTKFACFIPPKQRVKGRFLNIIPLSKWGKQMLKLYEQSKDLTAEERGVLSVLKDYEQLISDLYFQCDVMSEMFEILKTKGLNETTKKACENLVDQSQSTPYFKEEVKLYLQTNLKEDLGEKSLICTSDIIESFFGKYKNGMGQNLQNGITDSCLNIPNYGKQLSCQEILIALNKTKVIDLKEWKNKNIKEQMLSKKKNLYKIAVSFFSKTTIFLTP